MSPEPGGWSSRLMAALLDTLIGVGASWLVLSIVLFGGLTLLGDAGESIPAIEVLLPTAFLVIPILAACVYLALGWAGGQTVGMSAAGLVVVQAANLEPPGLGRAVLRAVLTLALALWSVLWVMMTVAGIALVPEEPVAVAFVPLFAAPLALPGFSYGRAVTSENRQTFHDYRLGLAVLKSASVRLANLPRASEDVDFRTGPLEP